MSMKQNTMKLTARKADPLLVAIDDALRECESCLTMGIDHTPGSLAALKDLAERFGSLGMVALSDQLRRAADGSLGELLVARSALLAAMLYLWVRDAAPNTSV